jgi:hypothetical protein
MFLKSGRFSYPSFPGSAVTLVSGGLGRGYRVLNASKATTIRVNATGAVQDLFAKCSTDVKSDGEIKISAAAASSVEGIYDAIQPSVEIRSGRFSSGGNDWPDPLVIVQEHRGAIYRVFNSGRNAFRVRVAGGPNILLASKQCVDVACVEVAAGQEARIRIFKENDNDIIDGIYERIETGVDVRSGRFRIKDAAAAHTIIDLTGTLGTDVVRYRVINASEVTIKLKFDGASEVEIGAEQSYDFEITTQRKVTVEPEAFPGTIQGSYEFLSRG